MAKRLIIYIYTWVYPKVSGLAAWSENCKWYSSLPLGTVVSLFVSQFSEFCRHNPSYCFSMSVYRCCCFFRYPLNPETFGYVLVFIHLFILRSQPTIVSKDLQTMKQEFQPRLGDRYQPLLLNNELFTPHIRKPILYYLQYLLETR
jgi:hypothetical protein